MYAAVKYSSSKPRVGESGRMYGSGIRTGACGGREKDTFLRLGDGARTELLAEGTRVRAEVYDAQGNHALSEWMPLRAPPERTASTLGLELPVGRGLGR